MSSSSKRCLIVLDLDGTLIDVQLHANDQKQVSFFDEDYYHRFTLKDDDGKDLFYSLAVRPGLYRFLTFLFANFDVAVWTAAHVTYMNAVVNHIFTQTQRQELVFAWSYAQCEPYIPDKCLRLKPLRRIWSRYFNRYSKSNTFIIDDTPETYSENVDNALPIKTWTREELIDTDLMSLERSLFSFCCFRAGGDFSGSEPGPAQKQTADIVSVQNGIEMLPIPQGAQQPMAVANVDQDQKLACSSLKTQDGHIVGSEVCRHTDDAQIAVRAHD